MPLPTTVLVTGVGGGAIGNQILGALGLMGDAYHIFAADADPFSHGLYMGHEAFILPRADRQEYVEVVLDIVASHRIKVLLPGTEVELERLVGASSTLRAAGCILLANPEPVVRICAHKGELTDWLLANGFSTPRTADRQTWKTLAHDVGFPLVGKPATHTGGSKGVKILTDSAGVEGFLTETSGAVVLQEYVGDGECEYTVGVMIDRDGALIDSIVIRRKLAGLSLGVSRTVGTKNYLLSTGISQGFIVSNPIVQLRSEQLALAIGARGPLNIQCRLSGGDIKVFEVHARFSGTCAIRASAGFNEPDVLIRNFLTGEKFGPIPYSRDLVAIRALDHTLVSKDVFRGDFPEEPC
jgi:carbamoyl-phosphate synthase large subunit